MTTSKQQSTKEYCWLLFYTGVNQWGDTCVGRENIRTNYDLLSASDTDNTRLLEIEQKIRDENNFRTLSINNIIERR